MDKRDMSNKKRYIGDKEDYRCRKKEEKIYRSMRHITKENGNGYESSRTESARKGCQ